MHGKSHRKRRRAGGPTLRDVAARAGVSPGTVSKVMNGSRSISEATRRRVQEAALEVGYVAAPRGAAQLMGGYAAVISGRRVYPLSNSEFYQHVMIGIEDGLRAFGGYPLTQSVDGDDPSLEAVERLALNGAVRGFICVGCDVPQAVIDVFLRAGRPLVLVDHVDAQGAVDAVLSDGLGGGRLATEHLIQLGHRRIAFVGGPMDHAPLAERYHGFRLALALHGLEPWHAEPISAPGLFGFDLGCKAAEAILASDCRPTAVVAANDEVAVGLVRGLRERGVNVPDDISIVGFDGCRVGEFVEPRLTTVRVAAQDMGKLAVALLEGRIERPERPAARHVTPVELVVGGSTAPWSNSEHKSS